MNNYIEIIEDFVTYEIAKLLKEKGFHIECDHAYHNGILTDYTLFGFCFDGEFLYAPTLWMTLKWLRKIKECPIEILWHWNADNQCEEWYFRHHVELREQPQIEYFDEPEQAAEAAIKYCLENLI